jgi:hypothetical protein
MRHAEVTLILGPDEEVTRRGRDTVVRNAIGRRWHSAADEITVKALALPGAPPVADASSGDEVEGSIP